MVEAKESTSAYFDVYCNWRNLYSSFALARDSLDYSNSCARRSRFSNCFFKEVVSRSAADILSFKEVFSCKRWV